MSAFTSKINKLSQIQKQSASAALPGERIEDVDPDLIDCETQMRSKDNPGFSIESLTELGNDMRRDGQHEPVVLRKHPTQPGRFLMVAGERRWRGCKIAGIKLKAVVREITDDQARRIQRAENIQRENLTQLEIAIALREDKERLGTLEKVAAEWNKGLNWVAERIKFLQVVESDGQASKAVSSGVTADISAVNDLHRLEKADSAAAKAVLEQAEADPSINMRKAVREKLQRAKPASDKKGAKTHSRMRESPSQTAKPVQLARESADVVTNAAGRAEAISEQLGGLLLMLQKYPDVRTALGEVLDGTLQAEKELHRMRDALEALSRSG
jgi:ParB family chromosome partitioning protein